jgi:4-hydroxy-tetrahydrodipicolinate synthase
MVTPFDAAGHVDYAALEALTDWFIDAGVAGLFACCLSSEMYDLTPSERLGIAKCVFRRTAGRVKVVATGTFGGSVEEMATFSREMSEFCDAIVIVSAFFAAEDDPPETWLNNCR